MGGQYANKDDELMSPEMRSATNQALRVGIPGKPHYALCHLCKKRVSNKKLSRHVLEQHAPSIMAYRCNLCHLYIGPRRADRAKHITRRHLANSRFERSMAAVEDGECLSREDYNKAKAEMAAKNAHLRQATVISSDEEDDDEDGEDSAPEEPAPESTAGLIQAMRAQAEQRLGEGAIGTDLPRVPPQGLKKDLKVILTPIQVPGQTQPTTAATSAHGRRIVLTRVPSDAAVLEGITPSGMETVSQEDREDSMICGALSKADRKLSKRLAQEMS